MEVAIIPLL